ncbi:efflux RND transporter periplasmic adaptor subunit [Rhabdochromatium marinum]|uniref:efflux RND transporter periplasmic adaptor subunit n=1 Tax=Rhabdochromatium marinum TaxID=48729 RepID=UPI001903D021
MIAWAPVQAAAESWRYPFPGVVRAVQRAPLSFEVGGRIEALSVDVGEGVLAGQVLARLASTSYRLAFEARTAAVDEAVAQLREAEQQFRRQQDLHGRASASEAALDEALAARATAQARLAVARAERRNAEKALRDTVLHAPYAGWVASRSAEPQQQVIAGETVLELQGEARGFEVLVSIPETLVVRLEREDVAPVSVAACPGKTLRARVAEIGTPNNRNSSFPVTLRLASADCALKPGMTAEVMIADRLDVPHQPGTGAATRIPLTAFLGGDGETQRAFVFVPDSADSALGVLEARDIQIEQLTAEGALVRGGLTPVEIIATRGLAFLRDGQRVRRLVSASPTERVAP